MKFARFGYFPLLIGSVFVAACSGDPKGDAAPTTTVRRVPAAAKYHATAELTGDINARGDYVVEFSSADPKVTSCESVTSPKRPVTFAIPMPSLSLGEYEVRGIAAAQPYRGPGRYGKGAIKAMSLTATKVGEKDAQKFVSAARSTVDLSVQRDGSGTFTFADLVGPSGALSGSVTWTCK